MENVEKILKECGAFLEGHFKLTSGKHGRQYFEKAEILKHPIIVNDLCREIAEGVVSQLKATNRNRIKVVVGLAPIGVLLANRVAEHLEGFYQEKVIPVFTEKDEEGKMVFKRGYAREMLGKKVLIVDDVLTTGGSVGQVKKEKRAEYP